MMFNSLRRMMDKVTGVIRKEDVNNVKDNIFIIINKSVMPVLTEMVKDGEEVNKIANSKTINNIAMLSGIKIKDNKDFLVKLKGIFNNIAKEQKDIDALVNDKLSDIITDKTATVRDLAILKLINDLYAMSAFTLDVLYYVITAIDETNYPAIKYRNIQRLLPDYIATLKTYKDNFSKLVEEIGKLPTTVMPTDLNQVPMITKIINSVIKKDLPETDGFINNPIYHVRVWLVDNDIKEYENLKDKKRLLELRLAELKIANSGTRNPKLKKQIEYYEDKISGTEYKITKLSEV